VIGGDHRALVLIIHEAVDRGEVQDVLHRRWPDVIIKSLEHEDPTVAMSPCDAADLGRSPRHHDDDQVASNELILLAKLAFCAILHRHTAQDQQ
jgi:hypothetical protein